MLESREAGQSLGWPGWVAGALGALWLGLFPLWQDGSFSHITRAKWVGALILCGVTATAVLVSAAVLLARRQGRGRLRLHPAQGLALAYLAWVALSACLGSYAGSLNSRAEPTVWMGAIRYEGLLTQLCYITIFLCMSLMRPRLTWVLRATAAGIILLFAVTMLQYAGLNPLGLYPAVRSIRTNYEFQGTIGNIDMVNGYLCLAVPLTLGGFLLGRRADPLLLAGGWLGLMDILLMEVQAGVVAMLVMLGLLALLMLLRPETRSRGMVVLGVAAVCVAIRSLLALPWLDGTENIVFPYYATKIKWLVMACGPLCWLLAAWLRRHPGPALSPWRTAVLALAVILVCAGAVYALPMPSGGLGELQQVLHGNIQDSYGSYRLGIWRNTLLMARESPIFGTGPDTFLYAMGDHLKAAGITYPETFDNPHNEFLAILSNNGLPALALYLAMLGSIAAACLRRRGQPEALVLLGAILCYMAQGMFSFSICLVTPMFWAVCGMACAFSAKEPPLSVFSKKGVQS